MKVSQNGLHTNTLADLETVGCDGHPNRSAPSYNFEKMPQKQKRERDA